VKRRVWIVIGTIVGVIVVLNLIATGLDRAVGGSEPSGVTGSSYATTDSGLAAYAILLTRFGHDVSQSRGTLTNQTLDPSATLIVLEPQTLTDDDDATLLQFVAAGGRLVIGGDEPFYLQRLRDDAPTWRDQGTQRWTDIAPSLVGVREIVSAGTGSWDTPGSGHPLVQQGDLTLLTTEHVGAGDMFFLADASPLENAYLARSDNAALALELAGASGRDVIFAEGVHGYGSARGWRAIPGPWKAALALLALAGIVFVWSRARRFGPPDRKARTLPPARAEYVRSLSLTLERTRDREHALAPVQKWAQERVAARTALAPGASRDELAHAAHALGCPDDEITAMLDPVPDDQAVLALGDAVARLSEPSRRNT
jgi:hypothetical protein